jgi:hypothetical protein
VNCIENVPSIKPLNLLQDVHVFLANRGEEPVAMWPPARWLGSWLELPQSAILRKPTQDLHILDQRFLNGMLNRTNARV